MPLRLIYSKKKRVGGTSDEEVAAIKTAFYKNGWPSVLKGMIEPLEVESIVTPGVYAQLGDKKMAFEALNRLLERRAIILILSAPEPQFEPLRDDPRFDKLLRDIGLK